MRDAACDLLSVDASIAPEKRRVMFRVFILRHDALNRGALPPQHGALRQRSPAPARAAHMANPTVDRWGTPLCQHPKDTARGTTYCNHKSLTLSHFHLMYSEI